MGVNKVKTKQLGGFGVLPPGIMELLGGSGPIDFADVTALGSQLGGKTRLGTVKRSHGVMSNKERRKQRKRRGWVSEKREKFKS